MKHWVMGAALVIAALCGWGYPTKVDAAPVTVCNLPGSTNPSYCMEINSDGSINVSGGGGGGGAVTMASGAVAAGAYSLGSIVDGADVTQGAKADSACGTDTGTCTISAILKKIAANITSGTVALGNAAMAASVPVTMASNQTAISVTNFQTATGTASASFTSGTTGYVANDVVGGALTFTALCPASGNIMITGVQLEQDATSIISGETSFILYLYNVTPPSAYADSAAWDLGSGDRASWLGGPINIGTIVDLGSTLYVEANGINKQVQCAASGNLFGYLLSVGAYTPSAQVYKVTLHATPL